MPIVEVGERLELKSQYRVISADKQLTSHMCRMEEIQRRASGESKISIGRFKGNGVRTG